MNKILPSFLRPIGEKAPAVNYHECSFPHEANLGSAHSLWWPNGSSESPLVILLFIPGELRNFLRRGMLAEGLVVQAILGYLTSTLHF